MTIRSDAMEGIRDQHPIHMTCHQLCEIIYITPCESAVGQALCEGAVSSKRQHRGIEIDRRDVSDHPGKRNGEEAVAAAEVNHFCFRLNAQPLQHFTRPRPQRVPPVRIRHGGGGKNPSNALTVFGRGTGNRRPRNAARSSRLRLPGRYRSAGRPSRQRSRYPPTSAARLHTADHRRFRQSRDRCFEQQPRARVVRSRCRQTPDDRPAAARDRFR
jgi:hypothetical protein